ncbi:MAG TPA: CPBP family intramembrane glutamic endopeptidase [Pirellulales bacterium]|jgi:hypothetical protein|nr:CPBP family intramembrane glutamic endopeptidase [Pirellulales bacterium]
MTDELTTTTQPPPNIVRLALLFEGGLAVLACAAGCFLVTPPWQRVLWRPTDAAYGLAATLPLVVGLFFMRRVRSGSLGKLNTVVDDILVPLFANCSIWQLGFISLVAGVGEELFFRGVLQPLLVTWWGAIAGICVVSVVFGLLHALTIAYAVLATLVGAYLGWLALATGNLLVPIITHALYDFVALIYLVRTSFAPSTDLPMNLSQR